MLTKVKLQHFKKFEDEIFDVSDGVVLAGPNNSGKTTLLQAIAVWHLALQYWLADHAESSKALKRTGVPVSRNNFTAIPLREMNLLWFDRDTAYSANEKENIKAGQPKVIAITVYGREVGKTEEWNLTVTLRYENKEQIYVKLTDGENSAITSVPQEARDLMVVHVPPFSGIGAEETGLQRGFQNRLVGQGKPGDILRNLLLEIYNTAQDEKDKDVKERDPEKLKCWTELTENVFELFGYRLKNPQYVATTDAFIRVDYTRGDDKTTFDIASAGSGFHQVLTLLGFFHARPSSVLLLDEPDAHLHVILQHQVYQKLQTIARRRGCQLLISTHSEVILENTGSEQILSFYGRPHRLAIDTHRDQVREALKRLSSMDILSAEQNRNILYVEDLTDLKILAMFAQILKHRAQNFLREPFACFLHGRDAREARAHFFALKAINPNVRGVLLLDGDNRKLLDREIGADNLVLLRWRRYEIENYLLHPAALLRFVAGNADDLFTNELRVRADNFLRDRLSPSDYNNPLGDGDYLATNPASKSLLPELFQKTGTPVSKKDYFMIAAQMLPSEIHGEVVEKLDEAADVLEC